MKHVYRNAKIPNILQDKNEQYLAFSQRLPAIPRSSDI